jgi:hypothetical protein
MVTPAHWQEIVKSMGSDPTVTAAREQADEGKQKIVSRPGTGNPPE